MRREGSVTGTVRLTSLLCLLSDGLRGEGLGITPSWVPPGARCASYSGLDVPVIMQLQFLQYYENEEVPQFPFLDRVL